MTKKNQSPWPICLMTAIAAVGILCCAVDAHGQAPNLVVSAGTSGQASTLTVTSDSQSPWKCFTVSGSAGQYNVIWAESNGTTGGIYFGTIALGTSASVGPVTPPAPSADLPIGALTTAVSAAIAAVPSDQAATMATTYESLAESIDTHLIVSPLQLQLATGTQLLANFNADQLATFKSFTTVVTGWLDAQQCAAKLTSDRMDKYASVYHAIAQAIKPDTVTPQPAPPATSAKPPMRTSDHAPSAKLPSPAESPKLAPPKPVGNSPCANGQCPAPVTAGPVTAGLVPTLAVRRETTKDTNHTKGTAVNYLDDLIKRLSEKGIELNNSGHFPLRNLVREARNALETVRESRDSLEELLGVLLLEYHNSNWLSGDNKTRNEQKRELVGSVIDFLGRPHSSSRSVMTERDPTYPPPQKRRRAEHNFGDPIRIPRPADPEVRRALAKQRKKLIRYLQRARVFPFPISKETDGHQNETNRSAPRESGDLRIPRLTRWA